MPEANRLAQEASPYLRQHATNAVDWWPWSDEAFAEARRRDVAVLISWAIRPATGATSWLMRASRTTRWRSC